MGIVLNIMNTQTQTILIGVTGCRKSIDGQDFDGAGHKYLAAVEDACDALALIIPTSGNKIDRKALLERVDGLLFTGSYSNVEPHHYNGLPSVEGTLHDPRRDATTLPLVRDAIEAGVPSFFICRGFQELNVAFGGTLHQRTFEVSGLDDHREDSGAPLGKRYAPVHSVTLRTDGPLADCAGGSSEAWVNSLHAQGIDRLGNDLEAEAWAPDGLVEGVSVRGAKTFAIGVQWHPEWKVMDTPFYQSLFKSFAAACRERRHSRNMTTPDAYRKTG